jgi:hypothetical protein
MGKITYGVDDEVMKPALDPRIRARPGFNPRGENIDGLLIDYDVAVTLRDGFTICNRCLSERRRSEPAAGQVVMLMGSTSAGLNLCL